MLHVRTSHERRCRHHHHPRLEINAAQKLHVTRRSERFHLQLRVNLHRGGLCCQLTRDAVWCEVETFAMLFMGSTSATSSNTTTGGIIALPNTVNFRKARAIGACLHYSSADTARSRQSQSLDISFAPEGNSDQLNTSVGDERSVLHT